MEKCAICNSELKFINTPLLNKGKLSTGATICTSCLKKVNRVSPSIANNINKFDANKIIELINKNKEKANKSPAPKIIASIVVVGLLVFGIKSCFIGTSNNVNYEIAGIDTENETIRVYLKDQITDTNLVKDIADHIYYKNKSAILAVNPDPVQISVKFFLSKESAAIGGLNTSFLYSYIVKQRNENVIFDVNSSLLDFVNKSSVRYDDCIKIHEYFRQKEITMCGYLNEITKISQKLAESEGPLPNKVMTKEEMFKKMDIHDKAFNQEIINLNNKYNIDSNHSLAASILEFDCGCVDY